MSDDDWVLVPDAARACLSVAHVEQLIRDVGDGPVGGISPLPVTHSLESARGSGWPASPRRCRARALAGAEHRRQFPPGTALPGFGARAGRDHR
ncbi:MAG: 2-C-methyl-D-erythritol 4-phosphate cytidylyltransferase [Rhodocyclaceae bacterium]|nr:2-C-methyl-D-erythritol 4-phosphate cytidylyltransferase [Rhodocyclaceae bacterium]